MGLFSDSQLEQINQTAKKSNSALQKSTRMASDSVNRELNESTEAVLEYFKDANSILITTKEQLHDYIDKCIEAGVAGIDTETTGLDRVNDTIVGTSLYYPGGVECYIPINHLSSIFKKPYKNQLTYEEVGEEYQRLVDAATRMIFANADFDLAMIYKDLHVDMCDICYYDVIIAWRCLKENEQKNGLKELYNKYVLKGTGEPRKFSDFFSPKLFPYCQPEVAKLYAANDAKITYELYVWQLPYLTQGNAKCKKNHLEHIADLVWNVEFPLIKVCQMMHRIGAFIDKDTAKVLNARYSEMEKRESEILAGMVQEVIDNCYVQSPRSTRPPFISGKDFNPQSPPQVKYLLYDLMKLPKENGSGTGKELLHQLNLPITDQILKVRSLGVLINTFVKKMPNATTSDSRIHAQMKQIGADTGRLSCIAEGTKIRTAFHNCNIENLKVGDIVCCIDEDGAFTTERIFNIWNNGERNCLKIKYMVIGSDITGKLICTPDHLILTIYSEWVRADNLKIGDLLVGFNHMDCMIVEVSDAGVHTVFDIEVEHNHNFIANELCVHNCADPNLQNIPSHATDIRHMFRATDARNEMIDCESDESGIIEVELSKYDSVYDVEDNLVVVHNLKSGDFIKLILGKDQSQYKEIVSIDESVKDLSRCIIKLRE